MPDHSSVALWFWQGVTEVSPQQVARYLQCLSASERAFLSAISAQRRRLEYITGHYLLRQMLEHVVPDWALNLTVEHQRGRAPCLTGANAERVHFSLSHSGNAVACAVTLDKSLGLDLEWPRRRKYAAIAEACFSPTETEQLVQLSGAEQSAEFYRLWTLKESLLKAKAGQLNGENLAIAFRPVSDVTNSFWHCYSFKIPPFSFALTLSQALSETLEIRLYRPSLSAPCVLTPSMQGYCPVE